MSRKQLADRLMTLVVGLIFLLTAVFLILPVVTTVLMAFDSRDYLGPFPPQGLSLQWFDKLWDEQYLWAGFYTSLIVASAATLISSIVGTLAAVAMSRMTGAARDVLSSLFLSPLIVPGVIIGFALLMLFSALGIGSPLTRLIAGHLVITIPYSIRMALIGLLGVKSSLREAALSLGANEIQAFLTINFPLAKSSIAAGAVFAFAFSLDDLAISLFLSDFNTFTLPVALVGLLRSSFDLTIAAAAVGLMGVTLILLLVLDRTVGLDRVVGLSVDKA